MFKNEALFNLAMEILKAKHDISKLEPAETIKIFGAIYYELFKGMQNIGPDPKNWLV